MADFDFNAPYVDRRAWIIDHLQDLILEPKEILVVLLIDFFNQQHISIDHELISEKLKISVDEVEDIFTELSDKGYLSLDYADGSLIFNIEGIFELSKASDTSIDRSLLEQFEMEFAHPLSSTQMQRIIDMASMYDERRVICALNEAVCNEACDLNYIERILQNWQQKGLSTEDIENGKR